MGQLLLVGTKSFSFSVANLHCNSLTLFVTALKLGSNNTNNSIIVTRDRSEIVVTGLLNS